MRPAPDLVGRDFTATAPNQLWAADLTEIQTWDGKLYLAAVIDCYSRRCVGWAMADHMRAELVVGALEMAVRRRRPAPGLIHHSDQGSHYTSLVFGQRCHQAGIDRSMGAKGCALDSAVSEAFFASLKKELIRRCSWPTRRDVQTAIFAWIEGLVQPAPAALHDRLPVAARLREQISHDRAASLAASRLAHSHSMIKKKAA